MRHLEIRAGLYRDSVRLMQISSGLTASAGVRRALVAMATPVNLSLLSDMDFEMSAEAGPNDLVVAFEADDDESLAAALERLERELAGPVSPVALTPGARFTARRARSRWRLYLLIVLWL